MLPVVLVVLNDILIFVSLNSIFYVANLVSSVCERHPFLPLLVVVFVFFMLF
jgi:hypothetical protein